MPALCCERILGILQAFILEESKIKAVCTIYSTQSAPSGRNIFFFVETPDLLQLMSSNSAWTEITKNFLRQTPHFLLMGRKWGESHYSIVYNIFFLTFQSSFCVRCEKISLIYFFTPYFLSPSWGESGEKVVLTPYEPSLCSLFQSSVWWHFASVAKKE